MAAKLRSRLLVPHQRDSAIGHETSAAINDVFQGRVILDLKDKKFDKGSILSPPSFVARVAPGGSTTDGYKVFR